MSKTVPANLQTHLNGEVTTVATLWKITRTDTTVLGFTDHDADIVYDSVTYLAATGFNRTNIASNDRLAVDNLDLDGILDSTAIAVADLRAGLYDYAAVEIMLINWATPADGVVILRSGWLGEVTLHDNMYVAEVRGLAQALSRKIVELYTPQCLADLGDSRCTVDLGIGSSAAAPWNPDVVHTLGQRRRPLHLSVATTTHTLTNPGAETGDTSGWTNETGTLEAMAASGGHITAGSVSGDYYFYGGSVPTTQAYQRVDLVSDGISTGNLDALNCWFEAGWWQASFDGTESPGNIALRFRDSGLVLVGVDNQFGALRTIYNQTWTERRYTCLIPATTRYVDITLYGDRVGGGNNVGCYWDDITAKTHVVTRPGAITTHTLTNPGAETGDTSGWTSETGAWETVTSAGPSNPAFDTRFFYGGDNQALSEMSQQIDLVSDGVNTTSIDAQRAVFEVGCYYGTNGENNDQLQLELRFDDASQILIATATSGIFSGPDEGYWDHAVFRAVMPANTRYVDVVLRAIKISDTFNQVYVDAVHAKTFILASADTGRMYSVLTAGTSGVIEPVWDTTIGNTTSETGVNVNSEVQSALAWMTLNGSGATITIDGVTDARVFTYSETLTQAADYFDGGQIVWDTGNNAGLAMEIKDWDKGTSTISLYLPMPYAVVVSDTATITPGCDKTRNTCRDTFNNLVNFRGFGVLIPGLDQVLDYPNAVG